MRAVSVFCLLCLAGASATALSPVTRVVELMQGLSRKIEMEGKREEDLYESFVCWGKSVIEQKTASNAAGEQRTTELETYVADLDAGRIELSSERADLEKDIAQLFKDLEEAKALREKEHADFNDAEAEMNQAITALQSAMDVLNEATKDHKEGVLLSMRSHLNQGMESLAEHKLNLKHAVALGERFLAKADATFLRRLLTADVPKADWKKLNRKATFKMAYKARSFKIQDVLKKMHGTFSANLAEAKENENAAEAAYQKLSESKGAQLTTAQDALQKQTTENGKRGQTKEEAQEELSSLSTQIEDDTKFIQQTQASLDAKKEQWKVRSELRAGELAAMSKAINILHNDDARDLMKKSFASQESFLQVEQKSTSAASVIRTAARKSGDARLLKLATLVADSPKEKFGPVLDAIDKMIETLNENEEEDLAINQECEHGRMEDTRNAAVVSRDVDDMTDRITKLAEEIDQIKREVKQMEEKRERTAKELEEATEQRHKENEEWQTSDHEDDQAAILVNEAKEVIENFYKENDLVFIQKAHAPTVEAGKAPPPPPATFEGDYGGATGDNQGITSILEMIHEDIKKDQAKAKDEEDQSKEAFDKLKELSEEEIKALTESIDEQNGVKGEKENDVVQTETERGNSKGELDAVISKMREISPNCEYFTVNYQMRRQNRFVELDGLRKAKAILMGGKFSKAPNPDREMKPGDAFLQRRA